VYCASASFISKTWVVFLIARFNNSGSVSTQLQVGLFRGTSSPQVVQRMSRLCGWRVMSFCPSGARWAELRWHHAGGFFPSSDRRAFGECQGFRGRGRGFFRMAPLLGYLVVAYVAYLGYPNHLGKLKWL
jgi:hypothetical protein